MKEQLTILLGFGTGSIILTTVLWIYLKKTKNWMKKHVLRYETIIDKVEDE